MAPPVQTGGAVFLGAGQHMAFGDEFAGGIAISVSERFVPRRSRD
jgi:hypothetical protein